jgi:hypothetical protein
MAPIFVNNKILRTKQSRSKNRRPHLFGHPSKLGSARHRVYLARDQIHLTITLVIIRTNLLYRDSLFGDSTLVDSLGESSYYLFQTLIK